MDIGIMSISSADTRIRVMVAQSCEETGYGTSNLAVNFKNLFGITGKGIQGKKGGGF